MQMPRIHVLAIVVTTAVVAAACDNGKAAREDSLRVVQTQQLQLMSQLSSQKDSLTRVILDADEFIAKIDSKVSSVKGVKGKTVKGRKDLESPIQQQIQNRKEMLARVDALVKRAKETADQLAAAKEREAELKGEVVQLQGENEQLRQQLDENQKMVAQFSETIERQAATITTLETEIKTVGARLYTAYYIIGNEKELLKKGVVVREGGANLLIKRVGRTLQQARNLDPALFTQLDQRETQMIVVPDSTKRYRLVSRQNLDHAEVQDRDGTNFRGNLKITDINGFWGPTRYLILQER
jgi:regulator of replication initiation timing